MTLHTCAISGAASPGKHYILKTTEGDELVCPEALFHPAADANLGELLLHLAARVQKLEADLEARNSDVKITVGNISDAPAPKAKVPPARKASS